MCGILISYRMKGAGKPYSCVKPQSLQLTHFLREECAYPIKRGKLSAEVFLYHIINLSEKQKKLPAIQEGFHDLSGNRTRVSAVRGRRLSRLTNRPYLSFPTTSL